MFHHFVRLGNQQLKAFEPFNAWNPLKGHTHLNRLAAEKFVEVCMTFLVTSRCERLQDFRTWYLTDSFVKLVSQLGKLA